MNNIIIHIAAKKYIEHTNEKIYISSTNLNILLDKHKTKNIRCHYSKSSSKIRLKILNAIWKKGITKLKHKTFLNFIQVINIILLLSLSCLLFSNKWSSLFLTHCFFKENQNFTYVCHSWAPNIHQHSQDKTHHLVHK